MGWNGLEWAEIGWNQQEWAGMGKNQMEWLEHSFECVLFKGYATITNYM